MHVVYLATCWDLEKVVMRLCSLRPVTAEVRYPANYNMGATTDDLQVGAGSGRSCSDL